MEGEGVLGRGGYKGVKKKNWLCSVLFIALSTSVLSLTELHNFIHIKIILCNYTYLLTLIRGLKKIISMEKH